MKMNFYPRPLLSTSYFVTKEVRQSVQQLMSLYVYGTQIAKGMCTDDTCCASQCVFTLAGATAAWLTGRLPAFDECTLFFMCTCNSPKLYDITEIAAASCIIRTLERTSIIVSDFHYMPELNVIRVPFPSVTPFWPCFLKEKPTEKDMAYFRKILYLFMNFVTSRYDLPIYRSAIRPIRKSFQAYGSPLVGYYVNNTASEHVQDGMSLPHVLQTRKELVKQTRLDGSTGHTIMLPSLVQLSINAAFQ